MGQENQVFGLEIKTNYKNYTAKINNHCSGF
jgi:hypothetical protein